MRLATTSPADVDRARSLHQSGLREFLEGRPAAARRHLEGALAALTGPAGSSSPPDPAAERIRGRIWLTLAACLNELSGLRDALPALTQAADAADRAVDEELAVLVDAQRGAILVRAGQIRAAMPVLERAAARRFLLPLADQCNLLLSLSTSRLMLGELDRPRYELAEAIALAQQTGATLEQFKARHNLGYLHYLAGDLPNALRQMGEALALGGDLPRGVSLLDRARVLAEAGLLREADEALNEAEELFAGAGLEQDVGEVELSRAEIALMRSDAETARRFAARARARFRRRQSTRWFRHAALVVLYADFMAGRRTGAMLSTARSLSTQLAADGHHYASRMAALLAAELRLLAGDVQAGRAAAAAARAQPNDPIAVRLHARSVQAAVALRAGDPRAARRATRAGLRELERYRAGFGGIDLQTAGAVHGIRLADLDTSIALSTGRPDAVVAAAERGSAVSSRLAAVRPPRDDETARLLGELRQVVEQLREIELDRAAAELLQRRRRALEREIAARAWTLAGDGAVERPARLSELRAQALARDCVVVSFVAARGALHAVVSGAAPTRLHVLGPVAEVEELVRRTRADLDAAARGGLPAALRTAITGSLTRTLRGLDQALLTPLALPARRVVIVPTGSLATVPWPLLPSLRGTPVEVAPSGTAWLRACRAPAAPARRVTAVSGPGLHRAEQEVTEVTAHWPGAGLVCRDESTCDSVTEALTRSEIVHVAAHGRHSAENPLFSSLRLSDGSLFAYELEHVGRLADHVVLSACELGSATIRPGDEALGLTSVLLHLGTRSVVAGVAAVADDAACEAMVGYHALLRAGRDSAEALAQAAVVPAEAPLPLVCFGTSFTARP